MGIVDKHTYNLKCEVCGYIESGIVVDKGSNWSGPSWSDRTNFKLFDLEWGSSDGNEPIIIKAKCKSCNLDVKVSSFYSV